MIVMRILVFGGRNYSHEPFVHEALIEMTDGVPFRYVEIVHGDCETGTDRFAHNFCMKWRSWGLTEIRAPAAWDDTSAPGAVIRSRVGRNPYNLRAGFDRNEWMLARYKPTHALGTPGGNGTADMRKRIEAAIADGADIKLTLIDNHAKQSMEQDVEKEDGSTGAASL
jgi:hypothetical protein